LGPGGIPMILDSFDRLPVYAGLHPGFSRACEALRQMQASPPEDGRHAVDGERLFVIVSRDPGRGRDRSDLEFHRRYIDIQLVLEGHDVMGWRALGDCRQLKQDYDASKDIGFFADRPDSWLHVPTGHFTIFFPQDAHAPLAAEGALRKAVAKIAVDW